MAGLECSGLEISQIFWDKIWYPKNETGNADLYLKIKCVDRKKPPATVGNLISLIICSIVLMFLMRYMPMKDRIAMFVKYA